MAIVTVKNGISTMQNLVSPVSQSIKNKKYIGRYEVINVLGRGAFGTVKQGVDPVNGQSASISEYSHVGAKKCLIGYFWQVAIKVLKHRKAQSKREREMIEREKTALMMLDHPNIVKLLEVIEDEVKQVTYLVFEYAGGGELYSLLLSKGKLSETIARKYMRQIVSALEYCHFNLIVHRDLKPENLLLDETNDNIKISDFGLANFISPQKFSTFCGSLLYAAPEILCGLSYGGPPVDVYALGVILYCLVNGKQPFVANNPFGMIKRVQQGLQFDTEVSKDLRDLLLKMLTIDPKRRVTLSDIRHHPWILKDFNEPPQTFVPKFKTITHIDESIMSQVVELGFEDTPSARLAIVKNKAKQVVTAYHLCLSRKAREQTSPMQGGSSQADSATSLQNRSISREEVGDTSSPSQNAQRVCNYQKKNSEKKQATNQFNHLMKDIFKRSLETQTAIGERNNLRSTTSGVSSRDNDVETVDRSPEGIQSLNVAKERFSTATASRQTDVSSFGSTSGYSSSGSSFTNSEAEQGDIDSSSSSFTFHLKSAISTKEIRKKIMLSAQKCSLSCDKLSKYEFKIIKLFPALAQELPESTRIVFCVQIVKSKGLKKWKRLNLNLLEGDARLYKSLATYFLSAIKL